MKLYLYDDTRRDSFVPLHQTRPIGEILFGTATLRERVEKVLGLSCAGHLGGPDLLGFSESGAPATVAPDQVRTPCVVLNSQVVLESGPDAELRPGPLEVEGRLAGAVLGADAPPSELDAVLAERAPTGPTQRLNGSWVTDLWTLMSANAERIARDLHGAPDTAGIELPGVHRLGRNPLVLDAQVSIEPGVVFDTRDGPILIEAGVELRGPLRLEGPAFVARDSVLFGGSIGTSSIGPVCKIRGEVETSVILGFSNKAHDGFLGHAVLGRWVNLGALTTNSDLKNNYGSVRLRLPQGDVDTGLSKVGCLVGDHVKTGIGTMLNTGTVLGVGSNVFGGRMPPAWVPPFAWGSGDELVEYRFDKFIEVARIVMARRDQALDEGMAALLERAFERTRPQRAF